jgi:predicted pyridoxine 5'-phosphate oxidase superfamily flavin-nucleotide-binding protein
MSKLPVQVIDSWEERKGPCIFTTVDEQGVPNAVYVTCVRMYREEAFVIANNKFNKTKQNIFNGSKGSLLFLTEDNKSFQIKGNIEYQTSGDAYDDMKRWLDPKYPGYGATVLKITEVYSGAEKIC